MENEFRQDEGQTTSFAKATAVEDGQGQTSDDARAMAVKEQFEAKLRKSQVSAGYDITTHPNYEKAKNMKLVQRTLAEQQAMSISLEMLTQKTANTWMEESKELPVPDMLFSEFWREGELCILFADTNLGKSILGVQIADSISKGEAISGFKMEGKKQPVLYFDFELSAKQFEQRYSKEFTNHYNFDEQFTRVQINPNAYIPGKRSFEEHLCFSVEECLSTTDCKVVIIDNITYLRDEGRRTGKAQKLMRRLQELKNIYGLSVLVIAHTANRTTRKMITRDNVQGGKAMMQFCNSAFCIGESIAENHVRYLKQVKCSGQAVYNLDNVAVCQVVKPDNFLKFEFLYHGMEWELMKGVMGQARKEMIEFIRKRHAEGRKQRQIAGEMGISLGAVNKYLNQ